MWIGFNQSSIFREKMVVVGLEAAQVLDLSLESILMMILSLP
jgi:hypothetical protein